MKHCKNCGSPSGNYDLCKNCYKKKIDNIIADDDDIDDNIDDDIDNFDNENLIEYENESGVCCVCKDDAPYGKQCHDCYYETLDYKDNIDKNRKANELREWYYNLKASIYRQKNLSIKRSNCNKLIALAILCRDLHGDDSLISRVYKDIDNLLQNSNEDVKEVLTDYDLNKNETSGQVKCTDGHWVENDLEREIDDMLYQLRKPHVYAKRVNEITTRGVKSDWFIPVLSDTKGIYIELWGMDTEDYKKNKEEKIKLYKEEDLPLIQIYRKDILSDKTLLKDNLESEINKLEKELKKIK